MMPEMAAGAPPSLVMMWAVSWASTSSPGRQCVAMATWLHMVPEGRNIAASLPSSAAMRSQSSQTVGSSPCCSSPTSAAIIASFMAREGRVWVSEERLMRTGMDASKRWGAKDIVVSGGGRSAVGGLGRAERDGAHGRAIDVAGTLLEGVHHAAHGLVEDDADGGLQDA